MVEEWARALVNLPTNGWDVVASHSSKLGDSEDDGLQWLAVVIQRQVALL